MSTPPPPTDIEISVAEVAARLAAGESLLLLDVREEWEFDQAHLDGARNVPLAQIPMHLEELLQTPEVERQAGRAAQPRGAPRQSMIICYCHSGRRSLTAADWLRRAAATLRDDASAGSGIPDARSMAGGIDAWSVEIDPNIPRY